MRRVIAGVVVLLGGCGRLGFDLSDLASEGPGEAPDPVDASVDTGRPSPSDATAPRGDRFVPAVDAAIPPPDAPMVLDASVDASPVTPDGQGEARAPEPDGASPPDVSPPVIPPDYAVGLPPLAFAPVIDGDLEGGLIDVAMPVVGWTGATPLPSGFSASYAVAWWPEGIYFYLRVVDASRLPAPVTEPIWCGDSVELYVDYDGALGPSDYGMPGTRQFVIAAPVDAVTPSMRGEIYAATVLVGPWNSTEFVARPEVDGYAVEAVVRAADLGLASWSLLEGASVGVDISINVSFDTATIDPCSQRMGQYFLSVADASPDAGAAAPYFSPEGFVAPTLLGASP